MYTLNTKLLRELTSGLVPDIFSSEESFEVICEAMSWNFI